MNKELNINTWARKEHYYFFRKFEEPFFGVTIDLNCTKAYQFCKQNNIPFFLYYLHLSLKAANSIESFKYRIIDDKVIIHNRINGSPTINRADGTFGFSYMDYYEDLNEFIKYAQLEMNRVKEGKGLFPAVSGENVIHYSVLPWFKFTSVSHARSFSFQDSCPKISMGQMTTINGQNKMPLSIHVHHALMDGLHVGQFVTMYQDLMNEN